MNTSLCIDRRRDELQIANCKLQIANRHRGTILIITLGVLLVLSSFVLVFARAMRVEAMASANSQASAEALAIEQAGEQYAIAQILNQPTGVPEDVFTLDDTNWAGIQVGQGYFWIIRPDYGDQFFSQFGLVDESAKINLNLTVPNVDETAKQAIFAGLPGMTDDLAQAIMGWTDTSQNNTETNYYEALPSPYIAKQDTFESVEELLLVRGFDRQLLYGQMALPSTIVNSQNTLNFNGGGQGAPGGASSGVMTDDQLARGIYDLLTVYSKGTVTQSPAQKGRAAQTTTVLGAINFNRAPQEVLVALGLSASDVNAILQARSSATNSTDASWIGSAGISAQGMSVIAPFMTAAGGNGFHTNQYSAEIVAVSHDGRAFKRARIVIDITDQTTPKILYRRDFTYAGWPLDPEILESLRQGKGLPQGAYTTPVRRMM